eukprot:CAMPEP_0178523088 /NCGR_PEP_ID=MMETSP0696-20121128/28893_1 /TAXON_ID=265572 /ORGANISM="Extubocellulus spinifer, Strain CCMP396" /LENGTH=489 /DNA_ID=CAMNT_0020154273 /DNA_START=211 /DNA_END=1682 /DNA_ORIENTATION=-
MDQPDKQMEQPDKACADTNKDYAHDTSAGAESSETATINISDMPPNAEASVDFESIPSQRHQYSAIPSLPSQETTTRKGMAGNALLGLRNAAFSLEHHHQQQEAQQRPQENTARGMAGNALLGLRNAAFSLEHHHQQQEAQQRPQENTARGMAGNALLGLRNAAFSLEHHQQQQEAQQRPQENTAQRLATATTYSDTAVSAQAGRNKRKRVNEMIDSVLLTQQHHHQRQLSSQATVAHSDSNNDDDSPSFSDLLQVFDPQELKEAMATGAISDEDVAAQSIIASCAPYAADLTDVFDDLDAGNVPKMPSSMPKIPSSIADGASINASTMQQSMFAHGGNIEDIELPAGRITPSFIPAGLTVVTTSTTASAPSISSDRATNFSQANMLPAYPPQLPGLAGAFVQPSHGMLRSQRVQLRPPPFQQASHPRFVESMQFSEKTEKLLREWDKSVGLRFCHSKTMLKTSKSRKKLLAEVSKSSTLEYLKKHERE